MNILLTGIDGYVGWPTALKLSKAHPEARIVGVDNLGRRRWVEESGSVTAVPVLSMEERVELAAEYGFDNISYIEGDLTDRDFVLQLFDVYKFDAVLHLASQPSAPYSQINGERAIYTQTNNLAMNTNLLWAIREKGLVDTCRFVETTTTGVYGAPAFPIPEGFCTGVEGGIEDKVPLLGMAGSWYHMSKSFEASNLWLANRQWKMNCTDLRTSIVYGSGTPETRLDPGLATRFDFDFFFGVVLNRFCAMALVGHPITVYGKGEQKKPFISLDDCAASCAASLDAALSGHTVLNQTTETISIKQMAEAVRDAAGRKGITVEVNHIENPRVEDEEHKMEMDNSGFMKLLPDCNPDFEREVAAMIDTLLPYKKVFEAYKDRFL